MAGFPAFRAKQVWHWLYQKRVSSWESMRNLPPDVKSWLKESFSLPQVGDHPFEMPSESSEVALLSQPVKLLENLPDGDKVESVIIPSKRRNSSQLCYTLCISCQVGCRFNCAFCASGKAGLIRNLETGEMISQVISATRLTRKTPSNIVFMGIGEPFDNYDQSIKAARMMNDPDGFKIGARKITVSTSGIIPGIERFATEREQFELSVSLHAPDNATRSQLMPINNKYPLPDLIKACKAYTQTTKRIITFEYTLMRDINDQPRHAYDLIKRLQGFPCRINLIPLSPVAEFDAKPSAQFATNRFIEILQQSHINTTLRDSQGASLQAACGQLRFSKRK